MKPNIRQVHKFLSTVYEYLFCFQTQAFLQTSHPYIVEEMSITYETRIKKTPENGRLKKSFRKKCPWKMVPAEKRSRTNDPRKIFELIWAEYLIRQAANVFFTPWTPFNFRSCSAGYLAQKKQRGKKGRDLFILWPLISHIDLEMTIFIRFEL